MIEFPFQDAVQNKIDSEDIKDIRIPQLGENFFIITQTVYGKFHCEEAECICVEYVACHHLGGSCLERTVIVTLGKESKVEIREIDGKKYNIHTEPSIEQIPLKQKGTKFFDTKEEAEAIIEKIYNGEVYPPNYLFKRNCF